MSNTTGEKELKTDWPIEKGLTAKTQTQTGRVSNLIPEKSLISDKEKIGL